jgi:S-(hydroxymethyl)glutathione dehydrogenase/alcohol dehydrogenase
MRAAVLERFGEPLEVQELELAEPQGGEVLVRLVACGVCHTDLFTASGADPSGYAPAVLGHEGAGRRRAVARRLATSPPGDHVVTLFSPQCRECSHCRDQRTNLCLAIREQQNQGYLPTGRHGCRATASRSGTSWARRPSRSTRSCRRSRSRSVSQDAPLDRRLPVRRAASRPARRGDQHGEGRARLDCVVFGAGMVGLGASRLPAARAPSGSSASTSPRSGSSSRAARARPTRSRRARRGPADPRTDGGFGADYTFEATGNVAVMRQAVESARMGWGLATVCGVAGKGETLEVVPRFLITGRRVAGSSFGGVKGRDQVPQLVDRWLAGEIDVDPFVSHKLTLDEVNRGFELMEAQDGIRSVIEFG